MFSKLEHMSEKCYMLFILIWIKLIYKLCKNDFSNYDNRFLEILSLIIIQHRIIHNSVFVK